MDNYFGPPDGSRNRESVYGKEETYPCMRCGKLRTKEEGGTTFTVCDECWDNKQETEEKMKKQDKIDLMVNEIMRGEQIPILFDPYKNATDCMILWEKFSQGRSVEIASYIWTDAFSRKWAARRNNQRDIDYLEASAEGETMIEAMSECMFKASQKDINNPKVNSRKLSGN